MEYLVHIVSHDGVHVYLKKIEVIKDWPHPKTFKSLRYFLGLISYYKKIVKKYGNIASPLTTLLIKNAFSWNETTYQVF
jgi:hypothetical protein